VRVDPTLASAEPEAQLVRGLGPHHEVRPGSRPPGLGPRARGVALQGGGLFAESRAFA
jgi:hypothetical protein